MKRLVVCCDGTWNSADSSDDFTNVVRMARAAKPYDERTTPAIPQIVYYQAGVGSEGDDVQRVFGGAVGMGLSRNVREAYSFIAHNYCDGDEIFLFGFSRGAYTARSVAGLIGWAGLLHKRDMDDFALLWEGYRRSADDPARAQALAYFPDRHDSVRIRCIGVWDTVGALGIPGHLPDAFRAFYEFHDTELGAHVDFAFQALSLDEKRQEFVPAVWTQQSGVQGQVLKQVWFAGVHSNVGGGYAEHGLSDIALAWMASQVSELLALDTDYLRMRQDRRDKWALAKIYDSEHGWWHLLGTQTRQPFTKEPQSATFEAIHPSVKTRTDGMAYTSAAALTAPQLAANLAALTATEQLLQWGPNDVGPPIEPPRPPPNMLGKLLNDLGGG